MSSTRLEVLQKMKESELRYLRAMKEYLAEQKELREQLVAMEEADSAEKEAETPDLFAEEEEARKQEAKQQEEARKHEEKLRRQEEQKKKEQEEQTRKQKLQEEAQKRKQEDDERQKRKQEEKAASSASAPSPASAKLAVASASPAGASASPATKRKLTAAAASRTSMVVSGGGGNETPQQLVYQRLMTKAAGDTTTATEASNKDFNKSPKTAVDALVANSPDFSVLDLSGNTVFSMKKKDYCEAIGAALGSNTHVHTIKLSKCSLDALDAKAIAAGLAANDSVELLDLSSNKINNDGAKAIALALRSNTRLTELNLLGQPSAFGDSCLEEFVALFNYNVTLTKIIWRLDSRKSFAINKLLVRNNTIMKWLSEGKDVSSQVPSSCNIPELAALAANELNKARSVSSAPRLVPFDKNAVAAAASVPVVPAVVASAAAAAAVSVASVSGPATASPCDAWWLIEPTPNGILEDDGRTLVHNDGENGGGACISVASLCFESGVLEFSAICNSENMSILVGVTDASPESIDMTDATKNKQRYACSFFNGKVFGPDISFNFFEPCTEIAVRLDLDERKLYFAADGGEFGDAAFENLPPGLWRPYFALANGASLTCI